MAKNYVLVTIEDGSLDDTHVIGPGDTEVIVVDWDNVEIDITSAREALAELKEVYLAMDNAYDTTELFKVISRLESIITDADADDKGDPSLESAHRSFLASAGYGEED